MKIGGEIYILLYNTSLHLHFVNSRGMTGEWKIVFRVAYWNYCDHQDDNRL